MGVSRGGSPGGRGGGRAFRGGWSGGAGWGGTPPLSHARARAPGPTKGKARRRGAYASDGAARGKQTCPSACIIRESRGERGGGSVSGGAERERGRPWRRGGSSRG